MSDCTDWLERLIKLPKQVAEMDVNILKEIERATLEKWLKDIEKIEREYEKYRMICSVNKTLENYIDQAKSKLLSILNLKSDCMSWLEKLIELPKQIATSDLGETMNSVDEYIRRQWWDEVKRIQQEYYTKYLPECGKDEYLAGYISLAQLKLVLSFKMRNERVPEHNFDEKLLDIISSLERDIQHVRTWDVKRLASYYANLMRKGEAGFFKLIKDIVEKGQDPLEEIVRIPYIPVPLAKVICLVYENEIEKMKEAAKMIIENPLYGAAGIYRELNQVIEEAKKEREDVKRKLDYEYEEKLQEIYERLKSIESEKVEVERKLIKLEEELAKKEKDIQRIERERRELEESYREIVNRYETALKEQEKTIEELKKEIEKLENVKTKLMHVKAEQAKTEEEKRRIEEELKRIVALYNSIKEEVENIVKEEMELKSKKNEIEAIIKALKEEKDVFSEGVTSEQARLMEIDYAKIVESRIKEMNGWKVTISDEREKIYNELKLLDSSITYDSLSKIPNNIIITATKGWFRKSTFQVRILSHYKELYLAGVDKRKFTLAEIMPFVDKLKDKGDRFILALASVTGWSDKAIDYVRKTPYNLILIDLIAKEIYYNPANINLKDFLYYIRVS